MPFGIPIPLDPTALLSVGTYRIYFKDILDISKIPALALPLAVTFDGKEISVTQSVTIPPDRYYIQLEIRENPLPLIIVLAGIATLLGLTIGYLTFDKIERIVENPAAQIGIIVGAVLILFLIYRYFTKK